MRSMARDLAEKVATMKAEHKKRALEVVAADQAENSFESSNNTNGYRATVDWIRSRECISIFWVKDG